MFLKPRLAQGLKKYCQRASFEKPAWQLNTKVLTGGKFDMPAGRLFLKITDWRLLEQKFVISHN